MFYSELEFSDGERSIKLDSRTSDAIAIALRVNCDIFTSEEIVKECGVVLEDTLSIPADEPEEDDNLLELEPDEIKDEAQLKKWLRPASVKSINLTNILPHPSNRLPTNGTYKTAKANTRKCIKTSCAVEKKRRTQTNDWRTRRIRTGLTFKRSAWDHYDFRYRLYDEL